MGIMGRITLSPMTDDIDEETVKKYPGLESYAVCQSRAFMTGIGAFIVGAGFGYSGFVYLKNRFPFPPKFNIVFATASGVLLGYFVSRITSKQCQIMWTEIAVMKNKPTQTSDSMQKPSEGALPVDGEQMVQKNIYGDYMGKPVT